MVYYSIIKLAPVGRFSPGTSHIFTKLLWPVVKYIRARGIRLVLYLDDGIVSVKASKSQATATSKLVEDTLVKARLVINREKSKFMPSKHASWLGFDIDLDQGIIKVPQEKLKALKLLLQTVLEGNTIQVRLLASVVGKIISMCLALGDIARLGTRFLYFLIQSNCPGMTVSLLHQKLRTNYCFGLTI